jgi:hypothetical protein
MRVFLVFESDEVCAARFRHSDGNGQFAAQTTTRWRRAHRSDHDNSRVAVHTSACSPVPLQQPSSAREQSDDSVARALGEQNEASVAHALGERDEASVARELGERNVASVTRALGEQNVGSVAHALDKQKRPGKQEFSLHSPRYL